MRRPLRLLVLLALLLAAVVPAAAEDTGTYRLLDYQVTLTPHSDGVVAIDYYQKWKVTGGHIPWITVGLPGDDFDITKSGGAVRKIAPANQGDWSGVRIDLARDYRPGQSFEVSFSVNQRKLFDADDENYKLDFTPGWYDNAGIDSLTIRLKSFARVETVTADPPATSTSEDVLSWTKADLSPGEQFAISISFPKAALPAALPAESLQDTEGPSGDEAGPASDSTPHTSSITNVLIALAIFLVLFFVAWIAWMGWLDGPVGYSGGGIFYGSGPGSGWDSGGGDGDRFTGGGGGFGGGGFSCACACVSCACACACAGGGGAGCTRKRTTHTCPVCRPVIARPLVEMT
jgi:hypothetical protein